MARFWNLAQVPPGLQHDEVFKAVFAEMVYAGERPIYFDLNGGNEPLFLYLVALTMKLLGNNVIALRWPAVAGGLLGVAALAWTVRRILGWREALVASFLASVSLWHILDSRVSLRAIWLPLLLTLAYGFLWKWMAYRQKRHFLLGAILLGLSLYTYSSAILGVLALLAFAGWLVAAGAKSKAVVGLTGASLVALALGIPLAAHLATVPEATARINILSYELVQLRKGNPEPVIASAVKVAGMFGITGDPEWRYNVGGRPVFTVPLAISFYLGIFFSLKHIRDQRYAFILLWLVANLGASAVTGSAPSSLRSVGAAPAAFALASVGLLWLADTARRLRVPAALIGLVLAGALVWEAASSLVGYFVTWPRHPQVADVYRADIADMARFVGGLDWQGEVIISSEYAADLDRQSFEFLGFTNVRPRWFDGQRNLLLPPRETVLLIPSLRPLSPLLLEMVEEFEEVQKSSEHFQAWLWLPDTSTVEMIEPEAAVLGPWPGPIMNVGAPLIPASVKPGETLEFLIPWSVAAQAPGGHTISFFAHLLDSKGLLWSQADVITYPTSDWRLGDVVYQLMRLDIPIDMPPGRVEIEIGVYENATQPLTVVVDEIPFTRMSAGDVLIEQGKAAQQLSQTPEVVLKREFEDGWELVGATVSPRILQPGQEFEVSLWWRIGEPRSVSFSLSLARDKDAPIDLGTFTAFDGKILNGPLAPLRDRQIMRMPRVVERGQWHLYLHPDIGENSRFDLGEIFAAGVERSFAIPALPVQTDADYGAFRLLGADITKSVVEPGSELAFSLYWQDVETADKSYTVFTHLLAPDGQVVAGHDSIPAQGNRPIEGWIPGEIVKDEHVINVPTGLASGIYTLVAGLYEADVPGYPRLPFTSSRDGALGDAVVLERIEVN